MAAPISPATQSALQAAATSPSANLANNFTGPLTSPVAGRTDHLPVSVPPHSYVIPADVVAHLGQGNTLSGMKYLAKLFPHSTQPQGSGPGINVMVAGGEFVVSPADVATWGQGDPDAGHKVLDRFVKAQRADNIKTLKAMPGPVRNGSK